MNNSHSIKWELLFKDLLSGAALKNDVDHQGCNEQDGDLHRWTHKHRATTIFRRVTSAATFSISIHADLFVKLE